MRFTLIAHLELMRPLSRRSIDTCASWLLRRTGDLCVDESQHGSVLRMEDRVERSLRHCSWSPGLMDFTMGGHGERSQEGWMPSITGCLLFRFQEEENSPRNGRL